MIGIIGSALALDEKNDELLEAVSCLSKMEDPINAIPVLFPMDLNGHDDEGNMVRAYSVKNLKGIRLCFLDLNLTNNGGNFSREELKQAIESILSPDNGPYIAIAWTSCEDEATLREFKGFITDKKRMGNNYAAIDACAVKKPLGETQVVIDELQKQAWNEIGTILDANPQFKALIEWERTVRDSASDTISSLVSIASNKESLGNILKSLGHGSLGKINLAGNEFSAVNDALLILLKDRQASATSFNRDTWSLAITEPKESVDGRALSVYKNSLNYSLMIDTTGNLSKPIPGGVIVLDDEEYNRLRNIYKELPEEILELAQEIVRPDTIPPFGATPFPELKPVLLEITPICDFAQDNVKNRSKLMIGIRYAQIFNNSASGKCKPFTHSIETRYMKAPNIEKDFKFSFSANWTLTISLNDLTTILDRPTGAQLLDCRFREPLFNQIQRFYANHASRLGILEIN